MIGITPFAQMLRFYIEDAGVDCFGGYVVDEKYMPENGKIGGIEVISWETFTSTVSPDSCKILSSVTYNGMNKVREIMYHRIKNAGYTMANFIHPSAVVARNCDMGEGNIFLENVTLQPFTKIGNNNVFWSNVNICHHTVIGNFNFVAASCVILGKTVIKDRCFLGCNSTIKNRTVVKSDTLVGAAAYSSQDTEKESVIVPPYSVLLNKKPSDIRL